MTVQRSLAHPPAHARAPAHAHAHAPAPAHAQAHPPLVASAARPLRLVQMIDSLVTGGAERLILTLAEAVADRPGIDLRVFVLSDRATPFRTALEGMGIAVETFAGRSLVDPARLLRVMRALRRNRTEMVHAHLTSAIVVGGVAAGLLGLPFACTVHNVRPSVSRVSRARAMLYRAVLGRPRVHRIAVGTAVAEANAADAGGRPFAVIPNAVAPAIAWTGDDRAAARAEFGIPPDAPLIIAVGSLYPQKAFGDLLAAFALVRLRVPGAHLLIVGRGEQAALLAAQGAALGLGDSLTFAGLRLDVPRLLAAADLFASSSHWEGAPVSLLEAMATGLPCVMTDVGDNARMLAGTGAAIVPAANPPALAAALADLLGDPARRAAAGAAARARALSAYGSAAWVDRLSALYATATGRSDWCAGAMRPAPPRAPGEPVGAA